MKRIIGIVMLALALIGAWGVIKNWSKPTPTRTFGRSAAYESGRKAGKNTAPIVVIALALGGLYLLNTSHPTSKTHPNVCYPGAAWHKSKPAKIFLFTALGIVGLIACLLVLNLASRFFNRRPTGPTTRNNPAGWTRTGPYELGTQVQARWAGGLIPGRITEIHPGGFNVMVKLEDPRFPHPMLLSTNLLKPR
jgi:hypothetical protein